MSEVHIVMTNKTFLVNMVLKSRDYAFQMSNLRNCSLYCTLQYTCICSYQKVKPMCFSDLSDGKSVNNYNRAIRVSDRWICSNIRHSRISWFALYIFLRGDWGPPLLR